MRSGFQALENVVVVLVLAAAAALAAPPERYISRGPGGGGAFFGPAISPHQTDEIWLGSDMGNQFRSADFGRTWDTLDFRVQRGGSQWPRVGFTSRSNVCYALNGDTVARSSDGGATWANTPAGFSSYVLLVDPASTNRLLASNYTTLYLSTNSGATFASRYSSSDLLVAGAFWDGSTIYVGTQAGLLVSTNNGAAFALASAAGLGAGEALISFAGAKAGGTTRLFCVTWNAVDVYPGAQGSGYSSYRKVYRRDGLAGTWTPATNGLGANQLFALDMSPSNIGLVYAAGSDGSGQPSVVKSVDGGLNWTQVLRCTANANVATGWSGDDPGAWNWRKWSFGECALGFAVCASDPQRAVISDYGFVHVTRNGGATWAQAYSWAGDANPTGAPCDKARSYHGAGLEDTSCWWLDWFGSNTVFAGFTDIRGMLSTNGGASWLFPLSLAYNSTYQTVRHPGGTILAAASSVHDLYAWDTYCRDSRIDSGSGAVLYSTNQGVTWATLKNLGRPVVGLALDPNNSNALYAALVHSGSGGVYRTTNLLAGAGAAWAKLAVPPRTEGHPYNLRVLDDGTLVCTYSARITTDFTASAGAFVSTNGGASWLDRTGAGMTYYTKDLLIDPADPAQNRWWAGVWGEWGNSAGQGGLYRTTNRGLAWTKFMAGMSVGSCSAPPGHTNELYVTTELDGLWVSTNRWAAAPAFQPAAGYPFAFPSRVFFNPWDDNEVWVTSFGNGLRLGRRVEPQPVIESFDGAAALLRAASGQRVRLRTSTNLQTWAAGPPEVVPDSVLTARVDTAAAALFYSATAE